MLLVEFNGLWYFYHCVPVLEFLTQNYWTWKVVDFWFLGNNLCGEVPNFHW